MENKDKVLFSSTSEEERTRPIVLIAQLMQDMSHMRHVSEVFTWLAQTMSQRWHIPIVQFWAVQNYHFEQRQTELQAMACQNPNLPQPVHVNRQTVTIVEHFLRSKKSCTPQPITTLFPTPQAQVLTRFQINYWTCYSLASENLILPAGSIRGQDKIDTNLNLLATFFTQANPSPSLLRSISFLSAQALRIATQQGLILAKDAARPTPRLTRRSTNLNDLIPQSTLERSRTSTQKPFAQAILILDKTARRLYAAIDGQKSVGELAYQEHLSQLEIKEALHYLFDLQYIRFLSDEGVLVEDALSN